MDQMILSPKSGLVYSVITMKTKIRILLKDDQDPESFPGRGLIYKVVRH